MTVDRGVDWRYRRSSMRALTVLVVLGLAAPACFTELPGVPEGTGTSDAEGSTSTSGGSTPTGSEGALDEDPATEGGSSGGVSPPEEGLFTCQAAEPCGVWTLPDCTGVCAADPAGKCVLEQLRVRVSVGLRVRECAKGCTVDALLPRGDGTGMTRRQRASVGADELLTKYEAPRLCELRGEEFFASCLAAFTPECADPDQWFAACEPLAVTTCL